MISYHSFWLYNHCWLSVKSMTPYFVALVNVLLPMFCHIGWGMPYLHIFVYEIVELLGAMADKWIETFSVFGI